MNKNRPRFLSLHLIRLPVPGLVSILHRASGALLFLLLPLLLWMLQASLRSISTYTSLVETLRQPWAKVGMILLLWAFLHHFLAGLRFLAIDLEWGVGIAQARASSRIVLGGSLLLTISMGVWLW